MNKNDLINRYLLDNEYKITITNKNIHIINYVSIEDFSSEKIIVKNKEGLITIFGKNLVITKMMDDEVLIVGDFSDIQL